MSRITLTILCAVIAAIITGMYFELPQLSNGVGAFIVIALVYAFVVAKREAGLMSVALEEQRKAEAAGMGSDEPIIPDWLKRVPGRTSSAN